MCYCSADKPERLQVMRRVYDEQPGIGAGVWSGPADVVAEPPAAAGVFTPKISADERAARKNSWAKAVDCSFGWAGRA